MRNRVLAVLGVAAMVATSVVGFAGATTLVADAAAAAVPTCTISISPNPVAVGVDVTVTVTGLAPNETFDVLYTKDGSPVGSGNNVADATGTFTNTTQLEPALAGSVLGYEITGETSGATCNATLSVLGTTTTTAAPTTTTSTTVAPPTTAPAAEAAAVSATPAFTG